MRLRIIGVLLIASLPITAANGEGSISRGVGAMTCGEFAKTYSKDPGLTEELAYAWAQGFMTATNVAVVTTGGKQFRDLAGDTKMQRAYIRSYCDEHPLADFMTAVVELYGTLPWVKAVSN
jgi:hypothetical protein